MAARQLVAFLVSVVLSSQILRADAKEDFEAVFGAESRKVQSTKETGDDLIFAKKLLQQAEKLMDDSSGQMLLYTKAYEFASADPGGYAVATAAMSQLAKDQPKQKAFADEKLLELYQRRYQALAKNKLQQRPQAEPYVEKLLAVAEEKLGQGDVQGASALATTAAEVVKLHSLKRSDQVQALTARIKTRQDAVAKLDKLRQQLQQQPRNQEARLQLVTMLIIEFDQTKDAAAYLESAPDTKEFKVLQLALKNPADLDADSAMTLADWYKAQSAKASALAKPSVLRRAIECYERFLAAHANKDTQRLKAESALADAKKLLPREVGPPQTVNLLRLIDPQRDTVRGTWVEKDGALIGDGTATLRIPYQPPEEYDFRIEFTRMNGTGSIGQMLSAAGASFTWIMAANLNKDCGIEEIDHKRAWENHTHVSDQSVLQNGRRYTSIVHIRKKGVSVEVEGRPIAQHETDFSDLTPHFRWDVGRNCLGIGSWDSKTAFHVIELVEISGEGKPSPRGR